MSTTVSKVQLPVISKESYVIHKKPDLGNLDDLERKLKTFKSGLNFDLTDYQSGRALPPEFYTDKQIWKALRVMLRQNWQAVGHLKDVAKPLDYFTVNYTSGPVLVIRDKEGILRAFKNICTHRKKPLVAPPEYPEKGNLAEVERLENTDMLKCFYHGMKFKVAEDSRLPQFVVDTWGPLVFVLMQDLRDKPEQIAQEKERLSTMLEPLKQITADMNIESFQMEEPWEDIMRTHFGFYDGNFCDSDHLKDTHPKLFENLDYPFYTRKYFGPASLQTCPIKKDSSSNNVRGGMAYYFKLPPTVAVNIYKQDRDRNISLLPGTVNKDVMDTNIVVPITETETKVIFGFHFPPGLDKASKDAYIESSKRIQEEDRLKCDSVQVGNESDDMEVEAVDSGIFFKPEMLEFAFQKWMIEELEKIVNQCL